MKQFHLLLQSIVPHHIFSRLMGWLANSRIIWLKNWMITTFIKRYNIDLSEAVIKKPTEYACFNDFFTRHLEMKYRPITEGDNIIVSPVDGTISEIGVINQNQLIQAKGHYFDLESLLAGDGILATQFYDGSFATLYLAPNNYHRVHMPLAGKLIKAIFVPGKLFSVDRMTAENIPQLYSRNERLICLFETAAGPMTVIFVGAMIVGSIQLSWMDQPIRSLDAKTITFEPAITLAKGEDLGCFKLGSTVILLFGKDSAKWAADQTANTPIRVGKTLGIASLP